MWIKSDGACSGGVRIIWMTSDFEWGILGTGFNTFYPDSEWTLVDTTVCNNMVIDVEDEVDRMKIIIRPLTDCDSLTLAHPELVLIGGAGVETGDRLADGMRGLVVRPNPVRWGEPVRITPARDVVLYDVLGRHVLAPRPFRSGDVLTLDTSRLAPGIYFIKSKHPQQDGAHLIVIR
jgi:hypothetical protein